MTKEKNLERIRKYSLNPEKMTNDELNYVYQYIGVISATMSQEDKAKLIESDSNFSNLGDITKTKLNLISEMNNSLYKKYRLEIDSERNKRKL